MSNFYKLAPLDRKGQAFPFTQLKGRVVLIVNVASKCGFTPQYAGLETLYKKYEKDGLCILGFPCNQFLNQEPGTNEEIGEFCRLNYGVTFPILKKINVNGAQADPVYNYLKNRKRGFLGLSRVKWNFEKFLVDREGNAVMRFSSTKSPESLEKDIQKYLA